MLLLAFAADRRGRPRARRGSSSRRARARRPLLAARCRLERRALGRAPGRSERDFFGPVLDGVPAGLPRLLRDAASVRPHRLSRSCTAVVAARRSSASRSLRRHARDRARRPVRRLARARRRASRWPATLVPGSDPLRVGRRSRWSASWRSSSCCGATSPARASPRPPRSRSCSVVLAGDRVDLRRGREARLPLLADAGIPTTGPTSRSSVRYVWHANYDGIQFPEKATTVMKVKVEGPKRSLYWRATTLDDYTGQSGTRTSSSASPNSASRSTPRAPLSAGGRAQRGELGPPGRSRSRRSGTRICSPRRSRCAGEPGTEAPVADAAGDVVVVPDSLRARPALLGLELRPASEPERAEQVPRRLPGRGRALPRGRLPAGPGVGTPNRDALMAVFFGTANEFGITALEPLYQDALGVTSGAQSPYEAAALARDLVPRSRRVHVRRAAARSGRRRAAARRVRRHGRSAATASTTRARWRSCSACSAFPPASPSALRAASTTRATRSGR